MATGFPAEVIALTSVAGIAIRARRRRRSLRSQHQDVRAFTIIVLDRQDHPEPGGVAERIIVTTTSGTMTRAMVASGLTGVTMVGVAGIATTSAGIAIADSPALPAASYIADGVAVPRTALYSPLAVVPPPAEAEKDYIDWLPWIIGLGAGSIAVAVLFFVCLGRPRGGVLFVDAGPVLANNPSSLVIKPKQRGARAGPSRKVSVWRGAKTSAVAPEEMTRVAVASRADRDHL